MNINRKLELGQHCFCNWSLLFCKQTQLKTLPHRQKKTKDVKLPQHHEGKGLGEDYHGRQVLPFKGWTWHWVLYHQMQANVRGELLNNMTSGKGVGSSYNPVSWAFNASSIFTS